MAGRRRVLVLAPAITRMQCMGNPYKRVGDDDREPGEGRPRSSSSSFWSSWGRRSSKAVKLGRGKYKAGQEPRRRRRWGFRVSKLRIRLLSPLLWLKKLQDAYVNMMLAVERNAGDCNGTVMGRPAMAQYNPYRGGAVPWMWPALPTPIVF